MDAPNPHTRLLLTAPDNAAPNRLVSDLRTAGIDVRATYAGTVSELQHWSGTETWDLLVCFTPGGPSASEVLEILGQHDTDLNVLVIDAQAASAGRDAQPGKGVIDVLGFGERGRLVSVIKRESACRQLKRTLMATEKRLNASTRQIMTLLDTSPLAYANVQDGLHLYCNRSYAEIFAGGDTASIMTRPLLDLVTGQDRERVRAMIMSPIQKDATLSVSGQALDGTRLPLVFRFSASSHAGTTCLQLQVSHDTGNAGYRATLEKLKSRDLLTRLENSTAFAARIEQAIHNAVVDQRYSALLVVEVNEFLDLTSGRGKANVNRVLNDIAAWLQQKIRIPFAAARIDDHVFGLLLHESNPGKTIALGQEIRSQINNRISTGMRDSLMLTCSIGLSLINDNSQDAETVLARARTNLHMMHKQHDAQSLITASGNTTPEAADMLHYLNMALKRDQFRLVFQPIVQLRGNAAPGYEVLSRMLDSQGNAIKPEHYLWLANLNGLGETLDRLVATRLMDLLARGSPCQTLVMKITHNTLASQTFLPWLSEQLATRKLSTELLVFEVSEIDYHSAPGPGKAFCRGLHELGIGISICHFGCAIDPFAVLREISPNFAKFDVTLVRDIIYSMQQQRHIEAMIKTLHSHNVQVIVPHVEDLDVLPVLWAVGVDHALGYSLRPPGHDMDYEFVAEEAITLTAIPP
jgi:diguanylate cyclase (GGDEF)-like protein